MCVCVCVCVSVSPSTTALSQPESRSGTIWCMNVVKGLPGVFYKDSIEIGDDRRPIVAVVLPKETGLAEFCVKRDSS